VGFAIAIAEHDPLWSGAHSPVHEMCGDIHAFTIYPATCGLHLAADLLNAYNHASPTQDFKCCAMDLLNLGSG
jgi:hypothetical protein